MTMKQEKKRIYLRAALALAALLVVLLALDNLSFVPSMLLTVLRKGAIYALVAVSMNLLNGFTGLFSLGQAGFMLLGAYTYAILTIPAASQKSIYQRYANGGIGFSIPELLSKPLGGFGLLLGVVFCLILAGFIAALFAFLIGLPVLRLKSDYLAIATLGFAEIIRAAIESIDKGQMEAARSLGLSYWKAMAKVVLPQAIRTMIPSIINQFIITLKDTSILSVIGFPELVNTAKNVNGIVMRSFEVWGIVGIMYLIVITALSVLAKNVERRLNRGRQ